MNLGDSWTDATWHDVPHSISGVGKMSSFSDSPAGAPPITLSSVSGATIREDTQNQSSLTASHQPAAGSGTQNLNSGTSSSHGNGSSSDASSPPSPRAAANAAAAASDSGQLDEEEAFWDARERRLESLRLTPLKLSANARTGATSMQQVETEASCLESQTVQRQSQLESDVVGPSRSSMGGVGLLQGEGTRMGGGGLSLPQAFSSSSISAASVRSKSNVVAAAAAALASSAAWQDVASVAPSSTSPAAAIGPQGGACASHASTKRRIGGGEISFAHSGGGSSLMHGSKSAAGIRVGAGAAAGGGIVGSDAQAGTGAAYGIPGWPAGVAAPPISASLLARLVWLCGRLCWAAQSMGGQVRLNPSRIYTPKVPLLSSIPFYSIFVLYHLMRIYSYYVHVCPLYLMLIYTHTMYVACI